MKKKLLIFLLTLIFIIAFIEAITLLQQRLENARTQTSLAEQQLEELQNQDQLLINQSLEEKIKKIQSTYKKTADVYEELLDLKNAGGKTTQLEESLAQVFDLLSKTDYQTAETNLASLSGQIKIESQKLAASFKIPESVPLINSPPASGYRRQQVPTESGTFMVSLVSADLNSTRVIVDTASESTCHNDCPVLPLSDYVSRNGAFAGINGSYFCPAAYPQCAGKTNSFDTLLMNKNKVYFNSENNVYSTVPVVVFYGNSARFIERSLDWGRATDVDAVIANQPLLLLGGQIKFSSGGDAKQGSKGSRSFIGTTGNTVYIGVVHNATVAESAVVLKTLGLENALNLDDGGSTALWSGGYKVGPGRNLPNVVLLMRK
jgi:exopolysaccharide biosynthesis protein